MSQELAIKADAAAAAEPPKHYRISTKLERTLKHVAEGKQVLKACELSGLSESGYYQAIRKQHVKDRLDELIAATMKRRGVEAMGRIEELSQSARSEYVSLEASKDLANRAGYAPPKDTGIGPSAVLNVQINLG